MQTQKFAGADKTNTSFLSPLERRVAPIVLPWIPGWLETYHLTMLTLLWSGLDPRIQLPRRPRPQVALGSVGNDRAAMGD